MVVPKVSKNPLQAPRLEEIRAGKKFWGYLETEALQSRYVLAAHFLRAARHVIEIGGYRGNVITDFLTGHPESVTVYSLDAEFEEREDETLNGAPCRVRHRRDFFQSHPHPREDLGVVALGLEIIGDIEPLFRLLQDSTLAVVEIAVEHEPSRNMLDQLFTHVDLRVRCDIGLDFSRNEALLEAQLEGNMNRPFWQRELFVLEPVGK